MQRAVPRRRPAETPMPNVTTDLVFRVEGLLRAAGGPLSRNELLRALARSRHSVARPRLNAALAVLDRYGVIHDGGRDGVVWLGRPSLAVLERLARAKPVG